MRMSGELPGGHEAPPLRKNLIEDGIILDLDDARTMGKLRREINRIKEDIDAGNNDPGHNPPMLWSGIPFPDKNISTGELNSQGRHLIVSIGGTNTNLLVMELKDGEIIANEFGNPRRGVEIEALQKKNRMPTPA